MSTEPWKSDEPKHLGWRQKCPKGRRSETQQGERTPAKSLMQHSSDAAAAASGTSFIKTQNTFMNAPISDTGKGQLS